MPGLYDNGAGNVTVPAGSTSGLYQLSQDINVLQDSDYGNANVANFLASGALTSNIITSGNVSGNYILGDGSQLTNLPIQPGTYGNANVATFMANFGSNTISTTGNITGGYILGNGSQLTGLPATYSNANVNAHLAAFGSNVISTTGNVTAGYFIGDGSQLTGLPASYGNANVAAFLPTYTGNLAGGNLAVANNSTIGGNLTVDGTIYGTFAGNISGNLVVPGSNTQVIFNNNGNAGASANLTFDSAINRLTVNGQIITGTVTNNGALSVGSQNADVTVAPLAGTPGNVVLGYGLSSGNINLLTNINQLSGQIDTVGNITASGNIAGNYFLGNAAFMTGIPASYGNANVAAYLPTYTGNIGGVIDFAGGNIQTSADYIGAFANSIQVEANAGDLMLYALNGNVSIQTPTVAVIGNTSQTGFISASGNVTGGNLITAGNVSGANLLGTIRTASQTNITTVGTLTNLSVDGNATVQGNSRVNGYIEAGTEIRFMDEPGGGDWVAVKAPASGLTTWTMTLPSTDGNSGQFLQTNGSGVTTWATPSGGTYGNANVANFLANGFGSNTITTTGTIEAGSFTAQSGLDNTTVNAFGIVSSGNIQTTASGIFVGSGAGLSSIPGANVTGTVANATFATSAASATVANSANSVAGANVTGTVASATQANTANVANSVSGSNVVGAVANATFATSAATATSATTAGTVTTAAQPNITSVGTLSSLTVSGNIGTGGILTDGYYYANGTPVSFGGGSTYGNANVASFLASGFGSNTIVTTGNITGGNLFGTIRTPNQSFITNVGTLGSLNVTGNISGGNLSITTNAVVGGSFFVNDGDAEFGKQLRVAGNIFANASGMQARYLTLEGPNNFITMQGTGNIVAIDNISTNRITVGITANIGAVQSDDYRYANGTPISFAGTYSNSNVSSFLAAFGSNTIVTTGNITGGNVIATTGVSAATVTATTATVTGNITGGNLKTSSVVIGATDISGATSITAFGNITGGNLITTGSGGNITGANRITGNVLVSGAVTLANTDGTAGQVLTTYGNGQTYFSSVAGGSYGDSNVNTLLASWGSNTLSTTGNVTVGNLNMTGRVFDTSGVFQVNAAGNIVLVPTGSVEISGPTVITGGRLTTGAVTYANVDGTAGQVLTTYGNGVTYFSTVSGGSGSPGGANTQIQFNNAGAFAGNAAMTFNNVTGNIGFGNLIIGNTGTSGTFYNVITNPNAYLGNSAATLSPARVLVGNGRNGDWAATTVADPFNNARNARLVASDAYIKTDNGQRNTEISAIAFADLNAGNIGTANLLTRIQGISSDVMVINGNSLQSSPFAIRGATLNAILGNIGGGGNATAAGISAQNSVVQVNQGSRANTAIGIVSQLQTVYSNTTSFGNIVNAVGYMSSFALNNGGNVTISVPQNAIGYYHPGTTNRFGLTTGNITPARVSSNYYAFLNDDDLAMAGLGSLRSFHEFQATDTIASGVLAVNKLDGQVQYIDVTENITSVTFSNFVTRVAAEQGATVARTTNQADTVTLILRQDSTGRTVTMPTGTGYRYAGGVSTVGTAANSITMISVTGIYNATTAATEYLITISPEFV